MFQSIFYIINIDVDILYEIHDDTHNGDTDKESDESEEVFCQEEYDKSHKNREVHVCRHNLGIEIVCLDGMHDEHHAHTGYHYRPATKSISDDDDRDTRDKSTKDWNKSKDKNNKCNGHDIWEWCTLENESNSK